MNEQSGSEPAFRAIVRRPGLHRVILQKRPEGVYILVFDQEGSNVSVRDDLQDDWHMAKQVCRDDFEITEEMWEEIGDTGFMAPT